MPDSVNRSVNTIEVYCEPARDKSHLAFAVSPLSGR